MKTKKLKPVKTKKLNDIIYALKDDDEKTTGVKIDVSTSHKETESNEYKKKNTK